MNKYTAFLLSVIIISGWSCSDSVTEVTPAFDMQLNEAEIAGGIMTPEILWKFERAGNIALSPDGETVLYTTTGYDLPTEASRTNIFAIPSTGGDAIQLTNNGGGSPQWFPDGTKIAFTAGGNLWTMNPDGSGKKAVKNFEDFEHYSISPSGEKILFTRRVKLDQTPNEKHNLPKAITLT